MKHVKGVSRKPARAQEIPLSEKIDFIVDVIEAFEPIIIAKDAD